MNFLEPHIVIKHFDIEPGMHVAELHKGSGYFTPHLIEKVGAYGKVYELGGELFTDEHASLPEQVDRVLATNLLFAAPEKRIIFSHAYRSLKQEGKLVVIEWHPDNAINGHVHDLMNEAEVHHLAGLAGFILEKRFNAGEHHYGVVFKRL